MFRVLTFFSYFFPIFTPYDATTLVIFPGRPRRIRRRDERNDVPLLLQKGGTRSAGG